MQDYSKPGSRCIHAWKKQKEFERRMFVDRMDRHWAKIAMATEAFEEALKKQKPWYRRLF